MPVTDQQREKNKTPPGRDHKCQKPKTPPSRDHKCETPKKKKDRCEMKEADGECLVFMVYRADLDRRVRNAIIRFSGRIKCYGGKILGVSTELKVNCAEDNPWGRRRDWCAVALVFPSQGKARFWFVSEPEVKQHDFPPPCDDFMVFSVPVRYIPQPGRMTFCWTEMSHIRDKGSYQANYVDKVTDLFDSKGVNHGVVFIKDREANQLDRLKDCWLGQNAHYRLDLYSSEDQFREIYDSDPFQSLRDTRDCLSETTSVLFTIDQKIC